MFTSAFYLSSSSKYSNGLDNNFHNDALLLLEERYLYHQINFAKQW